MKKIRSGKFIIIVSLLLVVGISTGFLVNQETRDFRIAKNLDIFFLSLQGAEYFLCG